MERFLDYFVPEKYVLDLKIDKNGKTIGGRVSVVGRALASKIKFHAVGLEITNVLIRGKSAKFTTKKDVLEVDLGDELIDENVNFHIYYNGSLNENMEGAYLSTYEYNGKTEMVVATQFESHYAREAFPCIDEPAAKAVFHLMLTVPKEDGEIVLSNTPVICVDEGDDNVKYSFWGTPRMSTYLLAWVIGKFHGKTVKNAHGVEVTTYCALNQEVDSVDFANEIAVKSLEFYDDNFGIPYPLKKLDQVALPDFEAGAMENWGLVTYRESLLLVSKNAALDTKKGVALTVAHELSHQWFGDLVTMQWWDDLWLNESFASVMEYFAVDAMHPEYQIFEDFFTGDCLMALGRDAYTDVQSVHQDVKTPEEIATLFDGAIVYSKGARLILMLIRLMGWENFCKGAKDYFEKHKYENTVGDDLWAALASYADFEPKKLIHAFIDKPGYPVIASESGDFEKFSQKRFLLDGLMKKEEWPIPEVMEDMSGHYVLNLNEAEFNERLEKFDELELEEKLRLLIDRSFVCRTDLASSASLIPLIWKFREENSAAVWSIVVTIVGQLKFFFDFESDEEKAFRNFVKNLVAPKIAEIGLVPKKTDDENILRLRSMLLALDYYGRNMDDQQKLAELYDKDYKKIDAEIRIDILNAKILLEPKVLDECLEAFKKTAEPEIKYDLLFSMTLTEEKQNLEKLLNLLGKSKVVKPQDQTSLFLRLYRNLRSRKEAFLWLTKNWDYVKEIAGDKSLDSYPRYMANFIRTKQEFEDWLSFFGPMRNDSALSRAIKIGEKEIKARIKLVEEDKDAVYRTLETMI